MKESVRQLRRSRFAIYKPKPKISIPQWADRYLFLPPEVASEPGKFHVDRAEYQRGMMEAITDPEVYRIVFMTSSQVGKSTILDAVIGYFVHQDPCPIMMVLPTLADCQDYSKNRLTPIIRDTPALTGIFRDAGKSKVSSDTVLDKAFPGGRLIMRGSNSPAGLSRISVRIILLDEIDKYEQTKEGDPIKLAIKRGQTFFNSKEILTSTPTIKGLSRIEAAYNESDQRHLHVPCPKCNGRQVLKWQNVKWKTDKKKELIKGSVVYVCEHCGAPIKNNDKQYMIDNGEWRGDQPFNGIAGFHLSELYSPWSTWEGMAKEFLNAKKNKKPLQEFINLSLAETWIEEGDEIDPDTIQKKEDYGDGVDVPNGGLILVGAVDVQHDRIEYEIIAYGIGEESWGIEYRILWGDTQQAQVWIDLELGLQKKYRHESGAEMIAMCVCIDSGDGYSTKKVYEFCARNEARRWFAVKGLANSIGKPITPTRPSVAGLEKVKLFPIGVDTAKTVIFSRLKIIDESGPGVMHFPKNYPDEYFKQLTGEKAIMKRDTAGFYHRIWKRIRRNEALDIRVYSLAALGIIRPNMELLAERGPYALAEKKNHFVKKRRRSGGVQL